MSALQESRRELMVQLEGLMKLLKVRVGGCFQAALTTQMSCSSSVTSASACPVMSEQGEAKGLNIFA